MTQDGGWKMKPKNIAEADAYDHFRMNDDINDKFNKQKSSTSNKSEQSSEAKKAASNSPTSSTRRPKNFTPPSHYKPFRPNFRANGRRRPFNYTPFHNKDRDYRAGRFGDRPFRGKDFRYKGYPRRQFPENRKARMDWIDGMCWFHYTKGESATSCLDSHRCSGYKSFNKKSKEL